MRASTPSIADHGQSRTVQHMDSTGRCANDCIVPLINDIRHVFRHVVVVVGVLTRLQDS